MPRRTKGQSVLTFKFRVIPLVRMTRSAMFAKVAAFMRTGRMADDVELVAADFGRSKSFRVAPGSTVDLASVDMQHLRQLYAAFASAEHKRFERVD